MQSLNIFGKKAKIKRKSIKGLDGQFCRQEYEIVIDPALSGEAYNITLLHEMIHAILDRCSVTHEIDSSIEEIISDIVSKCIIENFDIKPKKRR